MARLRRMLVMAVVATGLALPASAGAEIKPGHSIAGIYLGMPEAEVAKALGSVETVDNPFYRTLTSKARALSVALPHREGSWRLATYVETGSPSEVGPNGVRVGMTEAQLRGTGLQLECQANGEMGDSPTPPGERLCVHDNVERRTMFGIDAGRVIAIAVQGEPVAPPPTPQPPPGSCGPLTAIKLGGVEAQSDCWQQRGSTTPRTTRPVRLNGIDLLLSPGATIYVDKRRKLVRRKGAVAMRIGSLPLGQMPERLDVGGAVSYKYDFGQLPGEVAAIASLRLKGSYELKFDKPARTLAKLSVELPFKERDKPRGKGRKPRDKQFGPTSTTVEVGLQTSNARGLELGAVGAVWSGIDLPGGLELNDVSVKFESGIDANTNAANWKLIGSGKLKLKGGGQSKSLAAPEIDVKVTIGPGWTFEIKGGADHLNKPIWKLLYLQRVGATFGINPFKLGLDAAVSAGPEFDVPLVGTRALVRIGGGLTYTDSNPDTWELTGKGSWALAEFDGKLKIDTTGKLEQEGDVSYGILGAGVKGRYEGWIAKRTGLLKGRAWLTMPGGLAPLEGARGIVSNLGIAACWTGPGPDIGWGYTWGAPGPHLFATTCGLGEWEPDEPKAKPGRVAQLPGRPATLRVPGGRRTVALRATGAAAPPLVRVTGPGGMAVDAPAAGPPLHTAKLIVVKDTATRSTYVVIDRPVGGEYTIAPLPGSPAVTGVASSLALRPVQVRARVVGRGAKRRLRYRIADRGSARVSFVEDGGGVIRQLGVVRAARGVVRFRPAAGRGGRRRIVAVVHRDGLPVASRTVARFRARGVRRAPQPRAVRVRRRGARALITWRGARSRRYEVATEVAGRNMVARVSGRRRRLVVAAVPRGTRVQVEVRGFDRLGRLGRPGRANRRL